MMRQFWILVFCTACAIGCNNAAPTTPPEPKPRVNVNAPGVNVNVEKDKGVNVNVSPQK
jgi:hypothetical protein